MRRGKEAEGGGGRREREEAEGGRGGRKRDGRGGRGGGGGTFSKRFNWKLLNEQVCLVKTYSQP